MLGDHEIALAVAEVLEAEDYGTPLVLDPVLAASDGTSFMDGAGKKILQQRLFPLASLITPNLVETERLVGIMPRTEEDYRHAADRFAGFGCPHVLFKGGHADGLTVRDVLADAGTGQLTYFDAPRQETKHTHGTGCTPVGRHRVRAGAGLGVRGCDPARARLCARRNTNRARPWRRGAVRLICCSGQAFSCARHGGCRPCRSRWCCRAAD